MKRVITVLLLTAMLIGVLSLPAYAEGESNIENGGGGTGSGTDENKWSSGDEGVRVTVIRASDQSIVTTPVDFTNKRPSINVHFGKASKLHYRNGSPLTPVTTAYNYYNPTTAIPRIISSSSGNANIDEVKRYFCSEYMAMTIAETTCMSYDDLINGEYKIILEPIAFLTFGGLKYAMTATEAALYDQQLDGGLRAKLVSVSHKNLPLAMFLERPDLGYPAWSGSTTTAASNDNIIANLGILVSKEFSAS